ncbi:hypothetical protein AALT_g11020 [Alternaria alternata]|nr:hypothetical protein AALT_g11020 [Alternaria alternata]
MRPRRHNLFYQSGGGSKTGKALVLAPIREEQAIMACFSGSSGLITNWYCEGSAPQCCRDSRETLKEGIPWNCIPADGVCCGHGDYCSASINAICKRDKSGYECWAGSGAEVPTIVGNTPEMESDYSNVRGHKDEGEYESSATKSAWKAEVWAAWGMIGVGALWFL